MNNSNYTEPQILLGKDCETLNEQAGQKWYVEFYYNGNRTRLSTSVDGKQQLNRIKEYHEKLIAFSKLKEEITSLLESGEYGKPTAKKKNVAETPPVVPLFKDAVKDYLEWHRKKESRPKTIQSYDSKLKFFTSVLGDVLVSHIHYKDVSDLMTSLSNKHEWTNKTYNNAKLVYSAFFTYCIDCRYIESNPVSRIKAKPKSKSKKHKAFTDPHWGLIFKEVEKDAMLSMFCKMMYYTCIRPTELCRLQVKDIDFDKKEVFVSWEKSKNKKDGNVYLDDGIFDLVMENYMNADKEAYLFSNDNVLWGTKPFHPNKPYNRFVKILERLGLNDRGYTLYSIKHYSNVKKYLAGWNVADIMIANRHASLSETENYLRDLVDFVDVSKKRVPLLIGEEQ